MNFCKDCKNIAQEGNVTLCLATAISLIDGVARHSVDHCAKARGRNGRCGLDGRLFEPALVVAVELNDESTQEKVKAPRRAKAQKVAQESTNDQAE